MFVARVTALLNRRANELSIHTRHQELEARVVHLEAELHAVHKNAHQLEAIGRLAGGAHSPCTVRGISARAAFPRAARSRGVAWGTARDLGAAPLPGVP